MDCRVEVLPSIDQLCRHIAAVLLPLGSCTRLCLANFDVECQCFAEKGKTTVQEWSVTVWDGVGTGKGCLIITTIFLLNFGWSLSSRHDPAPAQTMQSIPRSKAAGQEKTFTQFVLLPLISHLAVHANHCPLWM